MGDGALNVAGSLVTKDGRTVRVMAQPGAEYPFLLAISGDAHREPVTLPLTALELEQLLTFLDQAAHWP